MGRIAFVFVLFIVVFSLVTYATEIMEPEIPILLTAALFLTNVVADHILTWKALQVGAKERNPIIAMLHGVVGVYKTSFVVLAFIVCTMYFFWSRVPVSEQLALGVAYAVIPINNVIVLRGKRKKWRSGD